MSSPVVAGLRKQYPGYDDIPDDEFVSSIHGAYYKDMPEEDFLQSMDDAYTPKPVMKPQTHWATNVLNALGDAAKSMPGQIWGDATGVEHGTLGYISNAMAEHQNKSLPAETPAQLRAKGYNPTQVRNVLRGNSAIQQQQTGEQLASTKKAQSDMARGAAFNVTMALGGPETELAEKGAAAFGKTALGAMAKNPLVRHAVMGAIGVGGYEGVRTGLEEGSLTNVPKAVVKGAITGAFAGPLFSHALGAVGAVLSIPKNIVAGYSEASARIIEQNAAAGRALAGTFLDNWVNKFHPDQIRNFPDIHNALAQGKITPAEAARILLDSNASDRPGGFFDTNVLQDPAKRGPAEEALTKKLQTWANAQPTARLQLRDLPRPVQPVAEVTGNAIPSGAVPEPNTIGTMTEPVTAPELSQQTLGQPIEPNAQLSAPAPDQGMPLESPAPMGVGGIAPEPGVVGLPEAAAPAVPKLAPLRPEGNVPPAPTPLTVEGVQPQAPAQPTFNTPAPVGPPLGLPGPELEPAALNVGESPVGPLSAPPEIPPRLVPPTGEVATPPSAVATDLGLPIERTAAPGSLAASVGGQPMPQWQEFVEGLGEATTRDVQQGIAEDVSPVAEMLRQEPPAPAPGVWHQVEMFADANIVAAKTRLNKRLSKTKMFTGLEPADLADMALIGANYMLKGAASLTEWSTHMVAEFGDGIKPHLERLYGEAKAVFENRRWLGYDRVRMVSADYLHRIGLGPGIASDYRPLNPTLMSSIAEMYSKMPDMPQQGTPAYQESVNSYKALLQELYEQHKHLVDSGLDIQFVDKNPYAASSALMKDLRNNWRLRVVRLNPAQAEAANPFMSVDEHNMFRAVHDFFGYGAEGFEFGGRGADAAWRKHASMFSDDAIPAMTTETRGQNAWSAQNNGAAAPSKGSLLPKEAWQDIIKERAREAGKLAAGLKQKKDVGVDTANIDAIARNLTRGVSLTVDPKKQLARALADAAEGIPAWQQQNQNSQNWYRSSVDDMMQQSEQEFPVLKDNPGKQGMFKIFLALSSTGNKPHLNYAYTVQMFDRYERTGKMPLLQRTGSELGLFGRPSLSKVNNLLDQFHGDEAALTEWLTTKNAKGVYNSVAGLGPKVGRFFLNLYGIHSEVTVDRWMLRWWNRISGVHTIAENEPITIGVRKQIIEAVNQIAEKHGIEPAQAQAILWDREKEVWRAAGMRDAGDLDFADAARLVLKNRVENRKTVLAKWNEREQPNLFAPKVRDLKVKRGK